MPSLQRKQEYFEKLLNLLEKYNKLLVVNADNVGSHHMQTIRKNLRGKAEVLMGKNVRYSSYCFETVLWETFE